MRGVLFNNSYAGSAQEAAQTSRDFLEGRIARRDG